MIELIALAGLFIAGLALFVVAGVAFLLVKIVLFVVLLPFKLLFKLIWAPFGLIGGALSLVAGAVLLPVILLVGLVVAVLAALATLITLIVPAIPFILLGLMIWTLMRKRPAAA